MAIKHHPDLSTLMSCAAGSQPEAFAAVMASHIAMCPECSRELKTMELIGTSLFEDLAPSKLDRSAPVVSARAGEEGETSAPARGVAIESKGDVPPPLVALLGDDLENVPWKRLAPGVWHYPVPLSEGAEGDLRLLKVAPGVALPEHGHGGEELTLLLKGSYRDALGEYHEGDVADLDVDVEHRPVADPEEGCICLVASDQKAKFKGIIARLMQPWTGM
jgi:putative transcriptional regulator